MHGKDHTNLDDSALLQQYKSTGNNAWLGILLERYSMLLFGVCMKYLKDQDAAKDAVQQIFLKSINELNKYDVVYFKSWLYILAKNHCLLQLRNTRYFSEPGDLVQSSDETSRLQHLEKEKTFNRLDEALEALKPEQKLCITLFYLQKLSYQQIADETAFSIMQVKSHIQNGKRNLKILMEQKQDNE